MQEEDLSPAFSASPFPRSLSVHRRPSFIYDVLASIASARTNPAPARVELDDTADKLASSIDSTKSLILFSASEASTSLATSPKRRPYDDHALRKILQSLERWHTLGAGLRLLSSLKCIRCSPKARQVSFEPSASSVFRSPGPCEKRLDIALEREEPRVGTYRRPDSLAATRKSTRSLVLRLVIRSSSKPAAGDEQ